MARKVENATFFAFGAQLGDVADPKCCRRLLALVSKRVLDAENGWADVENGYLHVENGCADVENGYSHVENGYSHVEIR
jgi:hypothetical protein